MAAQQPAGTVTLVFTDIEGSTRLLEELGAEAYRAALAEHRRVVREACARFEGYEVDYEGDAFFYAFASAQAAVSAMRAAMAGLDGGPIRVRVGIHTGEPMLDPPKYVGMDVHRAARLMAAAHGGQVVVSASTAALVRTEGLVDLGEHRFKDLAAAERVFQLGAGEFPPLRSLFRSNLPVPATPFLGRERELAEVAGLLAREDVRLLTLTGPGGTGKTRLALQAAAEAAESFPDGITWVPLAPVRDPALFLGAVAQSLGVKEEPGRPLNETIPGRLAGRRLMVLLDNLEHLLPDAAFDIAVLRDASPSLSLLATSRERLQLTGERVYTVPSLEEREGVDLFLARASNVGVDLEPTDPVQDLCARLDFLPLALELAAARTVALSPVQLLERLGERLDLLKGARDADPRQQTLRATIDWSFDLLSEDEQQVFAALSVFAGGCTFEAGQEVASADLETLQSLTDKSLLRSLDTSAGQRYWMLESLREYASECLRKTGLADEVRHQHANAMEGMCRAAAAGLRGWDQDLCIGRLDADFANLGVACRWLLDNGRSDTVAAMLASIWTYLHAYHPGDGRRMLGEALDAPDLEPSARVRSLATAGYPSFYVGGDDWATTLAEAEAMFREEDDRTGLAVTLGRRAWLELQHGAEARLVRSIVDDGLSVAATLEPASWERASALLLLGLTLAELGDLGSAAEHVSKSRRTWESLGDRVHAAEALNNLGWIALLAGDYESAQAYCEENLAVARSGKDSYRILLALGNLGLADALTGNWRALQPLIVEGLQIIVERGEISSLPEALVLTATLAARHRDAAQVATLIGACESIHGQTGTTWTTPERVLLDTVLLPVRDFDPTAFDRARRSGRTLEANRVIADALAGLGNVVAGLD